MKIKFIKFNKNQKISIKNSKIYKWKMTTKIIQIKMKRLLWKKDFNRQTTS